MYRYESDYIMRMIHLLRLLMERLLGLTGAQQREAGEDEIAKVMGLLTGITPGAALTLSPDQLADVLGSDGEGVARRFALAEILRMQGDFYQRLGEDEDALRSHRRSAQMYFRSYDAPAELLRQAYPSVRAMFRQFFAEFDAKDFLYAGSFFEAVRAWDAAEDAYCAAETEEEALVFYDRLAAIDEDDLTAGGLSRAEVSQGRERIVKLGRSTAPPNP